MVHKEGGVKNLKFQKTIHVVYEQPLKVCGMVGTTSTNINDITIRYVVCSNSILQKIFPLGSQSLVIWVLVSKSL